MSEASNVEKRESPAIESNDSKQPFSPNFGSKSDGCRIMKRLREDSSSQGVGGTEESEPEEKRRSFRLNPPTLIHGQAKPAPKEDDDSGDIITKRNFLRPSILSAPSTAAVQVSTTNPVNGKSTSTMNQPSVLGSGLLSAQVPLSNPFLKASGTDNSENEDNKQEFLFQSTIEQRVKENGKAEASSQVEVASSSSSLDNVNGSKENVFLEMSKGTSDASDISATKSAGFVFGSKMEERVVKNEADSTSGNSEAVKDNSTQFVFGSNLSDRIKNTSDAANTIFSTTPAESLIFPEPASDGVASSSCHRKLEEDAAAMFAASNTKPVMPEVAVLTGEEDEKNVLQIQCKLFHYNSVTQGWTEKGRGNLRLNDKRVSTSDQVFQSRLVMRTHGSLRLVLNTTIWAAMIVDKASSKSVRISAQNEDGDIGVYLIMATINDAEQIHRALEYRVLHLKQVKERKKELLENEPKNEETGQTSCPVESSVNSMNPEEPILGKDADDGKGNTGTIFSSAPGTADNNNITDGASGEPPCSQQSSDLRSPTNENNSKISSSTTPETKVDN